MSRNYYSEINLRVAWHAKHATGKIEDRLERITAIENQAKDKPPAKT